MAFKKKGKPKKKGDKPLVKQVKAISRQVSVLKDDIEVKNIVTQQALMAQTDNTIQNAHLTAIAEGTEYNQRVGREIKIRGIRLRFTVRGGDNDVGPQASRVMIVKSNDPQGNAPTGLELLESYDQTDNAYSSVNSDYNSDYVGKKRFNNAEDSGLFKVLYDSGPIWVASRYPGPGTAATNTWKRDQGLTTLKEIKKWIPGTMLGKVHFSGTTGASVKSGALYLMFLNGQSATTANNNTYAYHVNVLYEDL